MEHARGSKHPFSQFSQALKCFRTIRDDDLRGTRPLLFPLDLTSEILRRSFSSDCTSVLRAAKVARARHERGQTPDLTRDLKGTKQDSFANQVTKVDNNIKTTGDSGA